MSVKAKFQINNIEKDVYGYYAKGDNIEMNVVIGNSSEPYSEDRSFFNSTPSGQIKLFCVNPKANEQFVEGKKYYVTFEEAND